MKIKKKLLALILSLSVITSGLGVMATETPATTAAPANVVELASTEYNILKTLGFIGEDVALLKGNSLVTRAQFVGILFKIAGFADVVYPASEITFDDVTDATPYKDEIQYFYNSGLINGTSANIFSPDNYITYQQAAKIIVDLLGYEEFVYHSYGGDLNAFVAMAQKLNLTNNMSIGNVTSPLSAQNAIIMLYNAGRAEVFEPSIYQSTGNVIYDNWNGKELFEKIHNIYFGKGCMQSNGLVSILDAEPNNKVAIIDGVEYLISDCDLTGLVGCNVEFHYKWEKGDKTIVWAGLGGNNRMLEIKASDLVPSDNRYDMNTIVYKRNGRNTVVNFSSYADVIYNNTIYNGYSLSHIQPEMGFIRLIDNNNDSAYDLVIVEEYDNMFLTSILKEGPYLSGKYGNTIKLDEYENVTIYEDGKEIELESLKENIVITYVASANKSSIIIYVGSPVYSDTLVAFSVENGKTTLEFENKTVKFAPSYENLDPSKYVKLDPQLGRTYNMYFDKEGNIAEIQSASEGGLEYVLLTEAFPNEGRGADRNSAEMRILLSNNTFLTVTTRKSLKINGVKGTGKDILDDPRLYDENGDFLVQVVRVAINGDGEVTEFEFAYDNRANEYGFDNENFSLDYMEKASYSINDNGYGGFNYRYWVDNATICFVKINGVDLEEPYASINRTSVRHSKNDGPAMIYDSDENHVPAVILLEHNTLAYNTENVFLVDSICYKKIDDEYVKTLCGYLGSGYIEYPEFSSGIIPEGTKRGDVMKIAVYQNKLLRCDKSISLADRPEPKIDGELGGTPTILFSHLYSVCGTTITITSPDSLVSQVGNVLPIFIRWNKIPVTVYDVRNDTIRMGSFADVRPAMSPQKDGYFDTASNNVMLLLNCNRIYMTEMIVVIY